LATVLFALPLSTCLAQAAEMTAEQRECCEKMAGNCDASMMPGSHSCCQTPVADQTAATSRIRSSYFTYSLAILAEVIAPLPHSVSGISTRNFESPPKIPPQVFSILRI